ncbi:hypothetical protein CERSUDRAFT_76726 [Gelatoporia subvermispora B]|uniref:DNA 3'-5' helicase n=1 Tax=Ceriporiopsis subvermispora (strain B) TaxID=914234 RepID=M2Q9I7_CERS8|nr:hypothetical protein CERSUDRAFT_76726 [Gelatoporia subvermispora B]
MLTNYLSHLNRAQLQDYLLTYVSTQAVKCAPYTPLQILAGPGVGKTRVLAARTAHLVVHHKLLPSSICVVTFTQKAAEEVKVRLAQLIGPQTTSQLKIDTYRITRRMWDYELGLQYGTKTTCILKVTQEVVRAHSPFIRPTTFPREFSWICDYIMQAERGTCSPLEQVYEAGFSKNRVLQLQEIAIHLSGELRDVMKSHNALSFNDLITYSIKLFKTNPELQKSYEHVLVDEYQDTDRHQYCLLQTMTSTGQGITVVGDPDQSIYGWRGSDYRNVTRMQEDYLGIIQLPLEENYRSTARIVGFALAIISQDKGRIPKDLFTNNIAGCSPMLSMYPSEKAEANFIAEELERLKTSKARDLLNLNDAAILVYTIAEALRKTGIPYRLLINETISDPEEIKPILECLRFINEPCYAGSLSAMFKLFNGVGPKVIDAMLKEAERLQTHPLDVMTRICRGNFDGSMPRIRARILAATATLMKLREMLLEEYTASQIVQHLMEKTDTVARLQKTHPEDWYRHVRYFEALLQLCDTMEDKMSTLRPLLREEPNKPGKSLRMFLQWYPLASSQGCKIRRERLCDRSSPVTITTCHAAKGLEWPVVFVPFVNDASYATDEERRLLYVAITRAQAFLYVTYTKSAKSIASRFISDLPNKDALFHSTPPDFDNIALDEFAQMLGREMPFDGSSKGHPLPGQDQRKRASHWPSSIRSGMFTKDNLIDRLRMKIMEGAIYFLWESESGNLSSAFGKGQKCAKNFTVKDHYLDDERRVCNRRG